MTNADWTLVWPRKLTTDETAALQQRLRPLFSDGEDDDIQDIIDYAITVISNQKDINYMVEEIAGMELEFCPPDVSTQMGHHVYDYLQELQQRGSNNNNNNNEESTKPQVVSLKSSKGNALTMSGALGASRERSKTGESRGRNDPKDKRHNEAAKRGDERRDKRGQAFDRLAEKRNVRQGNQSEENRGPRGRGDDRMRNRDRNDGGRRGGPRDGPPAGRAGRGGRNERDHGGRGERDHGGRGERDHGGRGERDHGGRGAGRGGRDFRGGRTDDLGRGRHSGSRRKHDEEGFEETGLIKRARRDEQPHSEGYGGGYYEGYDESYEQPYQSGYKQAPWQSPGFRGRGRGGRFGRGVPPGRGRGFDNASYSENADVDPEAVAVNPSPMVADTFGRGFAGRGGFRGRGRGRGFYAPAYDHVKNMMKAKTWVRKKEGEENANEGQTSGGGEQSESHQES